MAQILGLICPIMGQDVMSGGKRKRMDSAIDISDKLYVRPIRMEDTDLIVAWRANPRVKNNFLYQQPLTAQVHINWMKTKVADGEVIQFIIVEKRNSSDGSQNEESRETSEVPIGSVYFRDYDPEAGSAEYGIFIGEDSAVGKGYGNQVASWAVGYGGTALKLKKLMLRVLADNAAAVKSYEKAGFEKYDIQKDYMDGRDLIFMRVDY